ncbi:MAG: HDOD domain-containing protein [Dehalococcoidia bacterium]|nr:HDOD domain-containing protein [Dehalococcoidia bacterium]
MEQEPVRQDGLALPPIGFDALCRTVADLQPSLSHGFVTLLEMRGAERFAPQDLAALISHDPEFGSNLHAAHIASTTPQPSERPFSARDAIDHWGYRIIHSSSVTNGIVKLLGEDAFLEPHRDFWLRAFVVGCYASVLAEVLQANEDSAFSGSLLRSAALFLLENHERSNSGAARRLAISNRSLLWDAETELLGGNHLDLGRHLCARCELSDTFMEVFNPAGQPNSLPDLILRATAAAERHGFTDPTGPVVPPHLSSEREPILDAYFRNAGATPEGVLYSIRGMLALTPLIDLGAAA